MIEIGKTQTLRVTRRTDPGLFLTDGENEVLLPNRYAPASAAPGDTLRVFVYTDSEDRPVATTKRPKAEAGGFAVLTVLGTSPVGAFVDLGLDKDLLVPFGEQRRPLAEGDRAVVRVVLDPKTRRLIGSTRIERYLDRDTSALKPGTPVEALIVGGGQEGVRAIVDDRYFAMIFPDEIFERLPVGSRRRAFVKKIREDGRVSISLSPQGYESVMNEADRVLDMLNREGGFLPYSDASSPEEIRSAFGMSKGSFKKLIGTLQREGKITIEHHGIRKKG